MLLYRIQLDDDEAETLVELIDTCPDKANEDCDCPVHGVINRFEMNNTDRRVTLIDDIDSW